MKVRQIRGKDYIFCDWRKKFVRLTPEEWVRQQFLHHLVDDLAYPASLIGVEVQLRDKRADAIVYRKDLTPLMLIECKAETVPLTQTTLDQAAVYNRQLNVPYLVLHNGPTTIIGHVEDAQITFAPQMPAYGDII